MSADRTVAVGEWVHSKVRCDGFTGGWRCFESVTGAFREGIESAREIARVHGWQVGVRVEWAHGIFDYCPEHARPISS